MLNVFRVTFSDPRFQIAKRRVTPKGNIERVLKPVHFLIVMIFA